MTAIQIPTLSTPLVSVASVTTNDQAKNAREGTITQPWYRVIQQLAGLPDSDEMATKSRVLAFSRDLALPDDTQTVGGAGFQPTAVIFVGGRDLAFATAIPAFVGLADSVGGGGCISTTSGLVNFAASPLFVLETSVDYLTGAVSMTGDGFAVQWTKSGAPSGTVSMAALCLR